MSADHCTDFDFQIGRWRVTHRRLKQRLSDCRDWETFDGSCEMRPVLGGNGNVEDNVLHISTGAYRALALRSFDPARGDWAIWWLDNRAPHSLDVPVIGRFENGVGTFLADDTLNGAPVKLRFLWLRTDTENPRWEQALSADGGESWETNWTMDFSGGEGCRDTRCERYGRRRPRTRLVRWSAYPSTVTPDLFRGPSGGLGKAKRRERHYGGAMAGGGYGIDWPELGEDLSTEGLLRGAHRYRCCVSEAKSLTISD